MDMYGNKLVPIMEYSDMSYPIKYPTPSPSSDASRSPQYTVLGNVNMSSARLVEDFESMTCNNGTEQFQDAHLEIIEHPIEKFRFRYKSEMSGTHGSLQGSSSEKNRKATYPTVQLKNYEGSAIVRCSLFTYSKEAPEHCRQPHPHRLVMKNDHEERVDPHDKRVDSHTNPGLKIVFKSMGIIHTAKKHIQEELRIKKSKLKEEEIRRNEPMRPFTTREELELKRAIQDEEKSTNLNVVCLRFDAFREDANGVLHRICAPTYSNPIFNLKSAMTGDLKIVRMDHATSPASGGQEIFLLVEKVAKKNIKVHIFEIDENDERMWSAEAKFHETDVHHQYAIVVRSPPYRNLNIEEHTRSVYIALFRPSDGEASEPRPFTYTPDRTSKRKRTRYDAEFSSSSLSMEMTTNVPAMILNLEHPTLASDDLQRYAPHVNSDEFNRLLPEMMLEIVDCFNGVQMMPTVQMNEHPSVRLDAVGRGNAQSVEKDLSKIKKQFYQIGAYVKAGQPDVDKMLKKKFEDKNDEGNNILHLCHIHHTDDLAKQLKASLLHLIDHLKLYDLLNDRNNDNETVLHLAIRNGPTVDQIKDLPLKSMKIDNRSSSPLHVAVDFDYGIDELCTHFQSKVLDQMNDNGLTALLYAVEQHKLSVVKKLIAHGAKVNAQDNRTGNNILQTAILGQHEDLIEYLVKNTSVNKQHANYESKTPAMLAKECLAGIKRFKVLRLLCPESVQNNFELFESALIKDEEESSSESEEEMELEIKTEDIPPEDDITISFDLIRELSKLTLSKEIIGKLYEDLNFGYMLDTNAFEDRNPIEFLIHLALTNNVRVNEIRATMTKHGITEAVQCIDRLIKR